MEYLFGCGRSSKRLCTSRLDLATLITCYCCCNTARLQTRPPRTCTRRFTSPARKVMRTSSLYSWIMAPTIFLSPRYSPRHHSLYTVLDLEAGSNAHFPPLPFVFCIFQSSILHSAFLISHFPIPHFFAHHFCLTWSNIFCSFSFSGPVLDSGASTAHPQL